MPKFERNTDIEQCKKDILYLTGGVENWKEKRFLYTAIICYMTHFPYNYSEDTAIKAYEQLTGDYPAIITG